MPKILTTHTAPSYASAPSDPMLGDMYYNTTDDSTYVYSVISNVQTWVKLGGKVNTQVYSTPGSYTWTRPENVQWLKAVVVISAGGGGGAGGLRTGSTAKTFASGGAGGGGGSMAIAYDLYVGDVSTISISVPSGGAAGAGQTFSKAAAATTTFTTTPAPSGSAGSGNATFGSYISCPSGSGGGGGVTSVNLTDVSGPTGGAAGAAPTITGLYSFVSSAGSAGAAGGGLVASVPSSAVSSTQSVPASAADGTGRLGMDRIQWSTATLGIGAGVVDRTVTAGTFTVASGTQSAPSTGYSVASGGWGGPAAYSDSAPAAGNGTTASARAKAGRAVAAYQSLTTGSTLTVNMGSSESGANYGNGGAGGPGLAVQATSSTAYNAQTLDLTGGSGGSGSGGLVSIAWVE